MISLIEALNYRCLKNVRQELGPFHVLVGPNASGKTTFLDALAFLGDWLRDGFDAAVGRRGDGLHDLTWGRSGDRFELAVEAVLPEADLPPIEGLTVGDYAIRYEVAFGIHPKTGKAGMIEEQILLTEKYSVANQSDSPRLGRGRLVRELRNLRLEGHWYPLIFLSLKPKKAEEWGASPEVPDKETEREIKEKGGETDSLYWQRCKPYPEMSILKQLPTEEFPSAAWLERLLTDGVHFLSLENDALRSPSAPGQGAMLTRNGSNLPWVVWELEKKHPDRHQGWVRHLRTALPELENIRTVERPEDRRRYLMLGFTGGMEIPSRLLSDGTLRMMALTIIPYAFDCRDVWLIEEPENCIHPLNQETVIQSLRSVYDGQVLVATHSPAILWLVRPENILMFQNTRNIGAKIILGDKHPRLVDWKGDPNMATLFAAGVLE
jgi:predicted ATPase